MANELVISAALKFLKGARSFDSRDLGGMFRGITLDVSGTDVVFHTQSIDTSAEALLDGDITTPGYLIGKNLEAAGGSNYLTIRSGLTGADVAKVRPQGICLFELATSTPFAIANGSAAEFIFAIVEA